MEHHTRPESVMVDISLPGWRWEVEFISDGSIEIERYESAAGVETDPELLKDLFAGAEPGETGLSPGSGGSEACGRCCWRYQRD
jgi:hypothetical protein